MTILAAFVIWRMVCEYRKQKNIQETAITGAAWIVASFGCLTFFAPIDVSNAFGIKNISSGIETSCATDSKGNIFCSKPAYQLVAIFDEKRKFIKNIQVQSGGKGFKLKINNDNSFDVACWRGLKIFKHNGINFAPTYKDITESEYSNFIGNDTLTMSVATDPSSMFFGIFQGFILFVIGAAIANRNNDELIMAIKSRFKFSNV